MTKFPEKKLQIKKILKFSDKIFSDKIFSDKLFSDKTNNDWKKSICNFLNFF